MTEDEKRERDRQRNDIRWVVSTPQGRRFYWNKMAECQSFRSQFIEDSNRMYYVQGRKSVGLDLYHDLLDASPSSFQMMQDENRAKETRKEIKDKNDIDKKQKNPTRIDSPSLPNTGTEKSTGG